MLKLIFIFLVVIAIIVVIRCIVHSIQDKRDDKRRARNIALTTSTYQPSRAQENVSASTQSTPTHSTYEYYKKSYKKSYKEYLAKLRSIYSQYGNDAFQHLTEIKEIAEIKDQTGYEWQTIEAGLNQVRCQIEASQQQSKSKPVHSVEQISHEEYLAKLKRLYMQYGNNAFHHIPELQAQTGYERSKVKADLKRIRTGCEHEKEREEGLRFAYLVQGRRQPSPRTTQTPSIPPQSQFSPSFRSVPQKAPTAHTQAPSKPTLSIEEQILNYLKSQPIKWEFPPKSEDNTLKNFRSSLVFGENVAAVYSDEVIKNLELAIQQKRARNPQLSDHNAAMEGNILALLYKYSYLMHIFHAMNAIKFDTTKVDVQKLWLLIQQDCNTRIGNLADEKQKNPAIQTILSKYAYDHQTMRLKVLTDATGREMDYIISSLMANSLVTVISLLFSNPQLLQTIKPYSADDIAGMMDTHIATAATMKFSTYSR